MSKLGNWLIARHKVDSWNAFDGTGYSQLSKNGLIFSFPVLIDIFISILAKHVSIRVCF